MTALLSIRELTKSYPGVLANDAVSFGLAPGEIHALLGENGAGKSTLVKMIYGLVRPDSGRMMLDGEAFTPANPQAARAAGVAMVFQHFSLFEAMSVAENIALGMANAPGRRDLSERIRTISTAYGLPLDPERMVGTLSVGERQRVEIVRCLLQNPRILIMDEPTSVLTPQEVEILFGTLRRLSEEGVAILYISHKLEEIRSLCSAATILRGGRVVDTCTPSQKSARELAEMMIGSALAQPPERPETTGEPMLTLTGLNMATEDHFGISLKDITLTVLAGEVIGIAGVAGNGQDELLLALSGETKSAPGQIMLGETDIGALGPNQRRNLGLLAAPEERLGHAAAPDMSLTENALLSGATRERLAWQGFIKPVTTANFARAIIARFDVRTPGPETAAKALSGGNLQKFLMGREILQRPRVLVVNQPTWGVDAHAAATIRAALVQLAADGAGVIVISQDLDELMEVSNRFAVLNMGALSDPQPVGEVSVEKIGLMMGGVHGEVADAHP